MSSLVANTYKVYKHFWPLVFLFRPGIRAVSGSKDYPDTRLPDGSPNFHVTNNTLVGWFWSLHDVLCRLIYKSSLAALSDDLINFPCRYFFSLPRPHRDTHMPYLLSYPSESLSISLSRCLCLCMCVFVSSFPIGLTSRILHIIAWDKKLHPSLIAEALSTRSQYCYRPKYSSNLWQTLTTGDVKLGNI